MLNNIYTIYYLTYGMKKVNVSLKNMVYEGNNVMKNV